MRRRKERIACGLRKAVSLVQSRARQRALRSGRFGHALPKAPTAPRGGRRRCGRKSTGSFWNRSPAPTSRASRMRCGAPAPGSSRTSSSADGDSGELSWVAGATGLNGIRGPRDMDESVASSASIPRTTGVEDPVALVRTAMDGVSSSSLFEGSPVKPTNCPESLRMRLCIPSRPESASRRSWT